MTNVLLITFAISVSFYLGLSNRLITYIKILALQGIYFLGLLLLSLLKSMWLILHLYLWKPLCLKRSPSRYF